MKGSSFPCLVLTAFRKWVEAYAKDEDLFFKDFAAAFSKLMELGVPFDAPKAAGPSFLETLKGWVGLK